MLYERWRQILRYRCTVADSKPPKGAVFKRHGTERLGKKGSLKGSGMYKEAERK